MLMRKVVAAALLSLSLVAFGIGGIVPNVDPIHVGSGDFVTHVDPIHVG